MGGDCPTGVLSRMATAKAKGRSEVLFDDFGCAEREVVSQGETCACDTTPHTILLEYQTPCNKDEHLQSSNSFSSPCQIRAQRPTIVECKRGVED